MLRIDKSGKTLIPLKRSALAEADHWERELQSMILAAPDAFSEELGESLWLVGQEVRPSEAVSDRIDILAVDESGSSVITELKRGSHKLQLLQAISYAGMVSKWSADRFIETLAENFSASNEDARAEIEEHTGADISSINQRQRLILIAEDFDPALLIATEWLHENFDVDVRCYRMQLSREEGGNDYLTCTCIYPPIEIATLTRGADGRTDQTTTAWASWDDALEGVENVALREFVRGEIAKKQEARLRYRQVIYRMGGERRFYISCKRLRGYAWQRGRFDGDLEYWKAALSKPDDVKPVNRQRDVRFHLVTTADFVAFEKAMKTDLVKADFSDPTDAEPGIDQL